MFKGIFKNLVPLFSEAELLPDTEPKKKIKKFKNCLADVFNEIIYDRKVPLVKVQRDTNIPFPTLDDWIKAKSCPLADDNLMVLNRYLDTNLEYLCFGIGSPDSLETQTKRIADYFKMDSELICKIMEGEILKEELDELAIGSIEWQMKG